MRWHLFKCSDPNKTACDCFWDRVCQNWDSTFLQAKITTTSFQILTQPKRIKKEVNKKFSEIWLHTNCKVFQILSGKRKSRDCRWRAMWHLWCGGLAYGTSSLSSHRLEHLTQPNLLGLRALNRLSTQCNSDLVSGQEVRAHLRVSAILWPHCWLDVYLQVDKLRQNMDTISVLLQRVRKNLPTRDQCPDYKTQRAGWLRIVPVSLLILIFGQIKFPFRWVFFLGGNSRLKGQN